jgi:hypothetical protein
MGFSTIKTGEIHATRRAFLSRAAIFLATNYRRGQLENNYVGVHLSDEIHKLLQRETVHANLFYIQ